MAPTKVSFSKFIQLCKEHASVSRGKVFLAEAHTDTSISHDRDEEVAPLGP